MMIHPKRQPITPAGIRAIACFLCLAALLLSPPAPGQAATFDKASRRAIDQAIAADILSKHTPGGVFWLEIQGRSYVRAYGARAWEPQREATSTDTIYDLASLTKVVATLPAVMQLVETGQLALDAPVTRYWPEFGQGGKGAITLYHLLTHTSGLRAGLALTPQWQGYDKAMELAGNEFAINPPGSVFRYSDINFIVLGELVRRASGLPLEEYVQRAIFQPLKMRHTGFRPSASLRGRIAPTERSGDTLLRGVVHDPTARRMGGVAGHAGLFSTAADLARYARMLLNEGELDGRRVLAPETVRRMTRIQTPPALPVRRGLGWDIDSPYSHPRGRSLPWGSYGHTGWTGTCLWIDPITGSFWLFLSNRVHPSGEGNVLPLQRTLGSIITQILFPEKSPQATRSHSPTTQNPTRANVALPADPPVGDTAMSRPVWNGIDVLQKGRYRLLKGKRVGLITNQTGRNRPGDSTIDLLFRAPGVKLVTLFSPEHGLRGDRDEKINDAVDNRTGLPIHSLYGAARRPQPEHLRGLDILVYDIQDIGCRFYTYISTLAYAMEAADQAGLAFMVLDRVNPIGGEIVDGPLLNGAFSFTACHSLPLRHGMTVGELALMFKAERKLSLDLTVSPLVFWKRQQWFDETGLTWIHPSPNMRSLTAASLYPGIGLLEVAEVSVGRGTPTPFEFVGAPYIDEHRLADALNQAALKGVRFHPARRTPQASVYQGQSCGGVQIEVVDRADLEPLAVALTLARQLDASYAPQFTIDKLNRLLQHPRTLAALKAGDPIAQIQASWQTDTQSFRERRDRFLIYR